MPSPLLLVDGSNLLYRAWFGFPARIVNRSTGRDLTGVFGFIALLRKAHRENAYGHEVVVVFDTESSADGRQGIQPDYKQQRLSADHSPMASYPDVIRLLDATGISWLEQPTAEADDAIATLACVARQADRDVAVFSTDRDFYQLLDDGRVRILNTRLSRGHQWLTGRHVIDRFGVTARRWPDFRALTGDASDNIPGVHGIGPKTAASLLAGDRSLDLLLPIVATHRRRAVRSALDQWDDVLRWRELIRLVNDLELPAGVLAGAPTPELLPAAQLLDALGLW
jgi:DNA polymerase-1